MKAKSGRKVRTDSSRNQARLIEVAKRAFADHGAGTSLEQIARDAGVAIGTLYRHFPTRDALIEAVYRQEIDALHEAALRLPAELAPADALRAWLLMFVDYMAAKEGMADTLKTLINGPNTLSADGAARNSAAFVKMVEDAAAAGAIRLDVEPLDLLRAVGGVAHINPSPNWKGSATRMVDFLIDGLRVEA